MAIFSKKDLQEAINKLKPHLKKEQLEKFAKKLNKADEDSIHFEWELIILSIFTAFRKLLHESGFGGKYPDISISLNIPSVSDLVADITTISDKGLKEAVIEKFEKKLGHEAARRKLKIEKFSFNFSHIKDGASVEDFLNEDLISFLDKISQDKLRADSYESTNKHLKIEYHPNKNQRTLGRVITSHTKLTNNPIFNALNSKYDQLKQAEGIPKGIILCDGESEMFFIGRKGDVLRWGAQEIITYFLERHSKINFVLMVWIDRTPVQTDGRNEFKINVQLFKNLNFDQLDPQIIEFLENLEANFPKAIMTIDNVRDCIQNSTIGNFAGREKLVV